MFSKSAKFYDAIYNFKDYQSEAQQIQRLLKSHNPSGQTLLDVGCGTGLHLTYLRSDFTCTGVDLDDKMLDMARQHCPGLKFLSGDMRDFQLTERFDFVISLFSSIAYMITTEDLQRAVLNMASHLKSDGCLIVEPWITPESFRPGTLGANFVDEPDLKIARMITTTRSGRLASLEFHYLVGTSDGVEHFTEIHETALHTHDEYTNAFAKAGLEVEFDPEGFTGRGLYIGRRS